MADPYYFSSELLRQEGQRKALGQSRGFRPSDLNAILRANFQNQQENEITQRKLALSEQEANDRANAAKQANRTAGIAGYTNIALQAPLAYRQYADIYKDWTKTGVTDKLASTSGQAVTTNMAVSPSTSGFTTSALPGSAPAISGPTYSGITGGTTSTTGLSVSGVSADALPTVATEQAGITAGSAGTTSAATGATTGAAVGYGALAGTAGYYIGSNLIHGKYSKVAGIAASTIAGAAAGGPYGAAAGLVVGVINAFF